MVTVRHQKKNKPVRQSFASITGRLAGLSPDHLRTGEESAVQPGQHRAEKHRYRCNAQMMPVITQT
jgi:hypothetical protein